MEIGVDNSASAGIKALGRRRTIRLDLPAPLGPANKKNGLCHAQAAFAVSAAFAPVVQRPRTCAARTAVRFRCRSALPMPSSVSFSRPPRRRLIALDRRLRLLHCQAGVLDHAAQGGPSIRSGRPPSGAWARLASRAC